MSAHTPVAARRSAKWHGELVERIEAAVEAFDFERSDAFRSLADLSQQTEIVGQVLDIDSTVIDGQIWTTPGTIFVTLNYDLKSNDPVELDDAYPIAVKFKVKDGVVLIDDITADTSSFYE